MNESKQKELAFEMVFLLGLLCHEMALFKNHQKMQFWNLNAHRSSEKLNEPLKSFMQKDGTLGCLRVEGHWVMGYARGGKY